MEQRAFVLHVSFRDPRGFSVEELWETKRQHETDHRRREISACPRERRAGKPARRASERVADVVEAEPPIALVCRSA
jgi:hypothetical protein